MQYLVVSCSMLLVAELVFTASFKLFGGLTYSQTLAICRGFFDPKNSASWFLKQPHIEATGFQIFNVFFYGSLGVLVVLFTNVCTSGWSQADCKLATPTWNLERAREHACRRLVSDCGRIFCVYLHLMHLYCLMWL